MTRILPEKIAQYRSELVGNQDALAALEIIEDWNRDSVDPLADAAESIATRNGIEGIQDNAEVRWFLETLLKIREFTKICEPENENFRENYLPALIPSIADFMSSSFGCPPGVAGSLATPFAIYIKEEGMEKFCKMSLS